MAPTDPSNVKQFFLPTIYYETPFMSSATDGDFGICLKWESNVNFVGDSCFSICEHGSGK